MLDLGQREHGSFRDPAGHIHFVDGRVFRTVKERARADYEHARDSGLLRRLEQRGMLVSAGEQDRSAFAGLEDDVAYVLEHPRLPFVSYPYEWIFPALKGAALLHLDVQIEALGRDMVLSDASAYNIQFDGPRPVFIDTLSFQRYREGDFWGGHRQFCEQFLNPLLMHSLLGVRPNNWYRGSLEGIDTRELDRLLQWRHRLSWNVLSNVTLQARMQQRSQNASARELTGIRQRKLPRRSYEAMLDGLRRWIAALQPRETGATVWQNYSRDNTYSNEEAELKHRVIERFAASVRPGLAWDIGCNTGEYSETLLRGGARYVVGLDFDHGALENAFGRAIARDLRLQCLFQDLANRSPGQGWRGLERHALESRGRPDALVALALEHHLAIGRNIPLPQVVQWLVSLAPQGIIEFVQKSDETVQRMLALRDDIFADYSEQTFVTALESVASIVERVPVSASGRVLYWYRSSP